MFQSVDFSLHSRKWLPGIFDIRVTLDFTLQGSGCSSLYKCAYVCSLIFLGLWSVSHMRKGLIFYRRLWSFAWHHLFAIGWLTHYQSSIKWVFLSPEWGTSNSRIRKQKLFLVWVRLEHSQSLSCGSFLIMDTLHTLDQYSRSMEDLSVGGYTFCYSLLLRSGSSDLVSPISQLTSAE